MAKFFYTMSKKKTKADKSASATNPRNPYDIALIGDKYYVKVYRPTINGGHELRYLRISRRQIEEDFPSRAERDCIPRFTGSVIIPQNINYQRNIDGFFNDYAPPAVTPEQGSWATIDRFLSHLFAAQKPLILDYLALTYLHPAQRLPVLLLVSRERGTGKTTFLNLLAAWYGDNMAFVDFHALRSRFNADWSGKLIVAVDEALLQRRQDSEMIKALATSRTMPREAKGRDRIVVPNFSRIILCSNDLNAPILIENEETRYWVVEVPPMLHGMEDPDILDKLVAELPAFAWYLIHEHQMTFPTAQSRLWFPPEAYETAALRRIKGASTPPDQQVVAEVVLDTMNELGIDTICLTLTDLQQLVTARGFAGTRPQKALRAWRGDVAHAPDNLTYDCYVQGCTLHRTPAKKTGRFYTLTREFLERHV